MRSAKALYRLLANAAFFTAVVATVAAAAGEYDVDLGALSQECSKLADVKGGFIQGFWMPAELWRYSLAQEGLLSAEGVEKISGSFQPYIMVAVTYVRTDEPAKIEFAPPEELKEIVRLRDRYGFIYEPIELADNDPVPKFLSIAWDKVIAPQFGPHGRGTCLHVFSAYDGQGRRIAEATGEGSFAVLVGDYELVWELPLTSLLRPKLCPECGRKLSGAYSFCPYDGTRLEEQGVDALGGGTR